MGLLDTLIDGMGKAIIAVSKEQQAEKERQERIKNSIPAEFKVISDGRTEIKQIEESIKQSHETP